MTAADDTRAALLVVDLQAGFATDDPAVEDLAGRVAAYVDAAGEQYAFVAASQFRSAPGSTYERLIGDGMRSDDEVALLDPIAERVQFHFESPHYGKLEPALLDRLEADDVDVLHVCGADTDQCVLATVLQAFDAGITPVVLADLTRSCAGSDPQEAGLIALRRAIGEARVVDAADAFEAPLGRE